MLAHFQLIDGCLRENLSIDADLFHHPFADFFSGDPLHGLGNKFQVALVSDVELNLVPDIREDRPAIVVDGRTEDLRIRKFNDATGRVSGWKNISPAKFPVPSVEITH